ncbi:hypothetical protein ACFUJX_06860 [Streptomyces rubiginosohelvolus]|uniref:hypothetical protein n=1 Tax=Streptomyces rubiginosohelvolus TaxID=67362 RepID=UPI003640FE6F
MLALAAARGALEEKASQITRKYMPRQLEEVQSALALELSDWQRVDAEWPMEIKSRLVLRLEGEAAARTQAYEDALRDQQLQHEIYESRVAHMRDKVLADADTARAWWLERHREGHQPIAWDEFNTHILPFVGRSDDAQSNAMRTAYVLAQAVERLEDDPARHKLFVATARLLMKEMDWPDLAEGLTLPEQRKLQPDQ